MISSSLIATADFQILIRLILAVFFGFSIGLEREITNKSAGLRTQILVCLGSTIFTLISIYGFNMLFNPDGSMVPHDPARVAAQVLTGVGFIGGGVILHHRGSIIGLTTAATLWVSASIGMAVGAGSYFLATVSTLITLLVLYLMRVFETKFLKKYIVKHAKIKVHIGLSPDNLEEIKTFINNKFDSILEIHLFKPQEENEECKIIFTIEIFASQPTQMVYNSLKDMKNYSSLNIQEVLERIE